MSKTNLFLPLKVFLTLVIFFNIGVCHNAFSFEARPLFELEIGDNSVDSGERVGMWVDEEKIVSYDKFYFPASFAAYHDLDLIIILDSIRGRICKFSTSGRYLGEVKLPFKYHPIDFAYFPQAEKVFIIFQDVPVVGVLDIDLSNSLRIKSHKTINIPDILGVGNLDTNIQNIWPCEVSSTYECIFVLNIGAESVSNAAFSYRNERLSPLGNIDRVIVEPIGMVANASVVGFAPESDSEILVKSLESSSTDKFKLSKELIPYYDKTPKAKEKYSDFISDVKGVLGLSNKADDGGDCLFARLAGTDARGNIYIEAYYGSAEDTINNAYLYKLNGTGDILGKIEILTSPRMLVNRFIFVDPDGYIFYMHKNARYKTIELYQFKIY